MPKPPLTVQNAAITTASVEIQTLTVSGKQVTLAVFRQLQEKPLILAGGTFAGQPWGTVNYHPDKCADHPEHWHVVWQDGDQLRRATVPTIAQFGEFWPPAGDLFATSWLHDLITTGAARYFPESLAERLASENGAPVKTGHDFNATLGVTPAAEPAAIAYRELLRAKKHNQSGDEAAAWITTLVTGAEERVAAALPALAAEVAEFSRTTDELYVEYKNTVAQEHARRTRHREARDVIARLPQLFIAV